MHLKITPDHLARQAIVYVRQSTLKQVLENTESTERQYALVEKAIEFGWPRTQVLVIGEDQGRSASSATGRSGFQQLVSVLSLGQAGILLALEISRFARSQSDWYRVLELAAIFHTLIANEDGLYDPQDHNDRLLLGLKGTISEAELWSIRARLLGGKWTKASKGELAWSALPMDGSPSIPTSKYRRRFGQSCTNFAAWAVPRPCCAIFGNTTCGCRGPCRVPTAQGMSPGKHRRMKRST